jgi:hypothetical protein
VAWVSSGKPTVFRSSFDFLRLLSLLSSNANFRPPLVTEVHGISFGLAVFVMCKLIFCPRNSALFDTKYWWFLLASIHLLKNSLQTRDKFLMHLENFL